MKRWFAFFLTAMLLVTSLTACGGNDKTNGSQNGTTAGDSTAGNQENGNMASGPENSPADSGSDGLLNDAGNALEDAGEGAGRAMEDVGRALTGDNRSGRADTRSAF